MNIFSDKKIQITTSKKNDAKIFYIVRIKINLSKIRTA